MCVVRWMASCVPQNCPLTNDTSALESHFAVNCTIFVVLVILVAFLLLNDKFTRVACSDHFNHPLGASGRGRWAQGAIDASFQGLALACFATWTHAMPAGQIACGLLGGQGADI